MASVLPGVEKLGSAAKGFTRGRLEATAGILETVIAEEALLGQLSEMTRGQKAIVKETEMLRVLTNIEVARLGEVGAGFEYLAHELNDFSQSVARSTNELTGHTEERRKAIAETHRTLELELPEMREEFRRIEESLDHALATVESTLGQMLRAVLTGAESEMGLLGRDFEGLAQQTNAILATAGVILRAAAVPPPSERQAQRPPRPPRSWRRSPMLVGPQRHPSAHPFPRGRRPSPSRLCCGCLFYRRKAERNDGGESQDPSPPHPPHSNPEHPGEIPAPDAPIDFAFFGYRLPATGYRLPATGYRLPATGYPHGITTRSSRGNFPSVSSLIRK
jgi:hypothetical protein